MMNKMQYFLWLVILAAPLALISCGDTGTTGNVSHNWVINALVSRDAATNRVTAYVEISRDNSAFWSALVKVDSTNLVSNGDGTYIASYSPALLGDTAHLSVETVTDNFKFQQLIPVPDTFQFEIDGLPGNQVRSSTSVINISRTNSDQGSSYFAVVKSDNSGSTAIGYRNLLSPLDLSLPNTAFRDSQGEFQLGSYSIWIVAYHDVPIQYAGLPFSLPSALTSMAANVNRVGVTGRTGAIYIPNKSVVTAVAAQ